MARALAEGVCWARLQAEDADQAHQNQINGDYIIEKTRPNQDQDSSEQSDDRRNGAIADGDGAASLSGYGLGDDHLQRDEWNPQRRTGFELHARSSIAVSWL